MRTTNKFLKKVIRELEKRNKEIRAKNKYIVDKKENFAQYIVDIF